MKKVAVAMSDECAAVLKSFAAQWGMTMGDVLYESARCHIHSMARDGCSATCSLLHTYDRKLDKRAAKDCYGHACYACAHNKACRVGLHPGGFECEDRYKHLSPPHNEAS